MITHVNSTKPAARRNERTRLTEEAVKKNNNIV